MKKQKSTLRENIYDSIIVGAFLIVSLIVCSFIINQNAKPQETPPEIVETSECDPQSISEEPSYNIKSLGTFTLTAYCPCYKCCGKYALNRPKDENGNEIVYTATSTIAKAGRTIAVDPDVIPLGSTVMIYGDDFIAEDTGSAIKGNRVDIYFPPDAHEQALCFGVQTAEIFIKEE